VPFVCGAGASSAGCERGPGYLYDFGLAEALSHEARAVAWDENPHNLFVDQEEYYADLPALGSDARRSIVLENCRHIAGRVEAVVRAGYTPVTIGGDHAIAAGSIAGFAQAKAAAGRVGVIWVDAHADLNTRSTSPSKAYHGMSLAALLGRGDPAFAGMARRTPVLRPENVAYVGLRDVDPAEVEAIRELGIAAYTMKDVTRRGAMAVFEEALAHVAKASDYLVLSIDLDAFDPDLAPAVGTPVGQGLRRREMFLVFRALAKAHTIDMVELVEFNPTLEGAEETARFARDILNVLL